jgi:hypothetical protein
MPKNPDSFNPFRRNQKYYSTKRKVYLKGKPVYSFAKQETKLNNFNEVKYINYDSSWTSPSFTVNKENIHSFQLSSNNIRNFYGKYNYFFNGYQISKPHEILNETKTEDIAFCRSNHSDTPKPLPSIEGKTLNEQNQEKKISDELGYFIYDQQVYPENINNNPEPTERFVNSQNKLMEYYLDNIVPEEIDNKLTYKYHSVNNKYSLTVGNTKYNHDQGNLSDNNNTAFAIEVTNTYGSETFVDTIRARNNKFTEFKLPSMGAELLLDNNEYPSLWKWKYWEYDNPYYRSNSGVLIDGIPTKDNPIEKNENFKYIDNNFHKIAYVDEKELRSRKTEGDVTISYAGPRKGAFIESLNKLEEDETSVTYYKEIFQYGKVDVNIDGQSGPFANYTYDEDTAKALLEWSLRPDVIHHACIAYIRYFYTARKPLNLESEFVDTYRENSGCCLPYEEGNCFSSNTFQDVISLNGSTASIFEYIGFNTISVEGTRTITDIERIPGIIYEEQNKSNSTIPYIDYLSTNLSVSLNPYYTNTTSTDYDDTDLPYQPYWVLNPEPNNVIDNIDARRYDFNHLVRKTPFFDPITLHYQYVIPLERPTNNYRKMVNTWDSFYKPHKSIDDEYISHPTSTIPISGGLINETCPDCIPERSHIKEFELTFTPYFDEDDVNEETPLSSRAITFKDITNSYIVQLSVDDHFISNGKYRFNYSTDIAYLPQTIEELREKYKNYTPEFYFW